MAEEPTGFVEELRRRKVVRVAAAYIVIGWVALQFFDLVLDNIDAPRWIMQAIMALLAIGFPATLVLAWAFDVSSDGIRMVPGKSRAFGILIAVITIAALAYAGWSFLEPGQGDQAARVVASEAELRVIDSIAVLPFESFSEDRQDEYFADGLADTLLHKLAQIENLRVIARNSSFQFKGSNRDTREIGELLQVVALLEGSVQRDGQDIRIIAQLIDSADGSHIWSRTFDDKFSNIFELQDRIAAAIIEQLRISISERDRLLILRKGTDSPEAFELLMRANGEASYDDRVAFDPDTDRILGLIDRALAIDPGYAQAWAARSGRFTSALFVEDDTARSPEYIDEARRAAEKATEADPEFAGGFVRLGWAHYRGNEFAAAERSIVKALELAPRDPDALRALGLLKISDDPQLALDLFTQALELDPQAQFIYRQIYMALDALGRLDEGVEILKHGVQRFPDQPVLLADLTGAYLYDKGDPAEAARWATRIVELDDQSQFGLRAMARIWASVGDAGRSGAWLAPLATRFSNAPGLAREMAVINLLSGDVVEARKVVESVPESPDFRFDRATPIGGACLVLGDAECLREQANKMSGWLTEYEADGREFGPSERYEIASAVLRNAAVANVWNRDTRELRSLVESSHGWPITGGRGTRYAGYLRVMLLSLLGNDEEAVLELQRTLDFGPEGFLYRDIFNLPPDLNPLLTRLAGAPGYAEWRNEFDGRREQSRGRLLEMERDGEIAKAAEVFP